MNRRLRVALRTLAVTVVLSLTGAGGGLGHAQPPTSPPFATPDTRGCPYQTTPPPPVDASEVPVPGQPAPSPLPRPDVPVGGAALGACDVVQPTGAPTLPDGISAAAWVVADLDSGQVLAAKDAHGLHRPASTMKLFTVVVALRALPLDQVLTATQADADVEGSGVGVGPGGQYTVRELLLGALLQSGNDTIQVLAEALGGAPATVEAVNALAAELGALDTRAATPSGLDGPGTSTSAYDLALAFRAAVREPDFLPLASTRTVQFPGYGGRAPFQVDNDNALLAGYPGALGGKTGFTDDARHTFVGAAERDGRRLVVTLLRGERTPLPPVQQAAALLDWGFALAPGTPGVGQLVEPGPGTPAVPGASSVSTPGAAPAGDPVTTAATDAAPERRSASVLGLAGLALVTALGVLLAVVALDSARRRRGS